MSDAGQSSEICPFEKNCPNGCPCPFYKCESIDTREMTFGFYYNSSDPLFELEDQTVKKDPYRKTRIVVTIFL